MDEFKQKSYTKTEEFFIVNVSSHAPIFFSFAVGAAKSRKQHILILWFICIVHNVSIQHSLCVWTGEDAVQAVNYGVDGILVSNHGARQLDGVPATVSCAFVCLCMGFFLLLSTPQQIKLCANLENHTLL